MHRFNDLAWNPAHRDIQARCKARYVAMPGRRKSPPR
jgi:hypothetical protein